MRAAAFVHKHRLNLPPAAPTYLTGGSPAAFSSEADVGSRQENASNSKLEAQMNHQWHDTMVETPEPNGPAYLTGWTISGLAVIGTIIAVWLLGI